MLFFEAWIPEALVLGAGLVSIRTVFLVGLGIGGYLILAVAVGLWLRRIRLQGSMAVPQDDQLSTQMAAAQKVSNKSLLALLENTSVANPSETNPAPALREDESNGPAEAKAVEELTRPSARS